MKKIFNYFAIAAIASLAIISCQKESKAPVEATTVKTHTVKFVASIADTKTVIDEEGDNGVTFSWGEGDEDRISIFEDRNETTNVITKINNELMTILAEFPGDDEGTHTYTAILNKNGVPATQTIGLIAYDEDSDVLVSDPVEINAGEITADESGKVSDVIALIFHRVVAMNKVTFNMPDGCADELIQKVTLTSNQALAGAYNCFSENPGWASDGSTTLTLNGDAEDGITIIDNGVATIYFNCLPVNGASLKIDVETENGSYTISTSSITLAEGKMNTYSVPLKEVKPSFVKVTEEPEDWSGQYLIVFEGATINNTEVTPKAFNGSLTTLDVPNNYIDVTITNNTIELNDENSNAFFTIEKSSEDLYTVTSASGKSIGNELKDGASQNGLKTGDYTNTISITNDGSVLISCANTDIKFNGASNQLRFRYHKSGQQSIYLYKYTGAEPLVPVEPTSYSISIDNAIDGGSVSADAEQATAGTTIKLTATADDGYEFDSWNVTNATTSEVISVENDEFVMPSSDVNVSATFREAGQGGDEEVASFIFNTDAGLSALGISKPSSGNGTNLGSKSYTSGPIIMTTTDGGTATRVWNSNGSTNLRIYKDGGSLTFTGATITEIKFSGSSLNNLSANCDTYSNGTWSGSATSVKFTASGSVNVNTIDVTYASGTTVTKYSVSCNTVEGGSLSASPASAEEDETVTLTATPATGYVFNNDWSVKDASNNTVDVIESTFSMPASNVTVSGSFSKVNYDITKNPSENGSYTVKKGDSEVSQAQYDDIITLTANPNDNYIFDHWVVEKASGENISVNNNAFFMPACAVSVSAYFTKAADVPEYASLADLVAAGAPTATAKKVTVTLTDEEITGIYMSGKYRNGIFLKSGEQEVEIYSYNVPDEWAVGGTVSGTLTECDWILYGSTWELKPADWSELTFTPSAGGDDSEDVTYTKITSLSDLTTGDYVIVGAQKANGLGELTYGTLNSGRIPYSQQYTNAPADISKASDDGSIWHVTVSGTSVTLYNTKNEKYIADAGSGKLKYASTGMSYTVACSNGIFSLASGTYFLCVNTSSDYWRNYASSTGYNKGVCLYFYKKTN